MHYAKAWPYKATMSSALTTLVADACKASKSIIYEGVCRTAPATPGLLISDLGNTVTCRYFIWSGAFPRMPNYTSPATDCAAVKLSHGR